MGDDMPPAPVPPLVCDEMLRGIGRWLRAAGYDTAYAERGSADRSVLASLAAGDRLLLTCDRRLAAAAGAGRALLLESDGIEGWAEELARRLGVDWLHAPFTRCLVDNRVLRAAREDERARLPEALRREGAGASICDGCGRIYWDGGHVRRMRARLARWRALAVARAPSAASGRGSPP